MLLARVAAELRSNDSFSICMLPVRFMERSYEVFNAADFWLETLFHLARECETVDSNFAAELRQTRSGLERRWNEELLECRALAAVLEAASRLGRKLVLMVENLQSLWETVDEDFGWKLRGALQTEPWIVLVGTAESRFEGIDDARQPFFEMFRIVDLKPLTASECQLLWRRLSNSAVSASEIRPLQILTGGCPRLLVTMVRSTRHRSMRQLMEALAELIEEHTEYFRGHLEALAKTERRVYLAVVDLWHPAGASEIAARARMDIRVVSTLLARLVKRGAVQADGNVRKRQYSAVDRLDGIYYKLCRERGESTAVRNLVRFMLALYIQPESTEFWSGLLVGTRRFCGGEDSLVQEPVAGRLRYPADTRDRLGEHERVLGSHETAIDCIGDGDDPQARIGLAWGFFGNVTAFCRLRDFETAARTCDQAIERFDGTDGAFFQGVKALIGSLAMVDGLVPGEPGIVVASEYETVAAALDDAISGSATWPVPGFAVLVPVMHWAKLRPLAASRRGEVTSRRAEAVLIACEELERALEALPFAHRAAFAWRSMWARSKALLVQEQRDEAINAFASAYTVFSPGSETMLNEMLWLVPDLISHGASEIELLEVLATDATKSDALAPLVVALRERVGAQVPAPIEIRDVAADIGKLIAKAAR